MNVSSEENEYKTKTAIKTVIDMVTQRGYKIIDELENTITMLKNEDKIVIFKNTVIKFNVDKLKEYISHLHTMEKKHCIIIYIDSITPPTKKLVRNSVDMEIEIFTEEEMQYNITKHILVPKHELLSPKDNKEFKKLYGLKFPTLLITDPISRFYNYKRGDIIKINRKSERGSNIMYRIVK